MALPVLQALLLAEHVYQDKTTDKWVICGVFCAVTIGKSQQIQKSEGNEPIPIPAAQLRRAGSPWAFISLTEVQGLKKFDIRYVELFGNTVMFRTEFHVKSQDPLAVIQMALPFPPLPPKEGVFVVELLCDDELIGSHRISVRKAPNAEGE